MSSPVENIQLLIEECRKRYRCVGLFGNIRLQFNRTDMGEGLLVMLLMDVPDRDNPDKTITIAQQHEVHGISQLRGHHAAAIAEVDRMVHKRLQNFVLHELDESFHVSGKRRIDPHVYD